MANLFNTKSILLIIITIFASSVHSIEDKCAACKAIAEELERGLSKMHICIKKVGLELELASNCQRHVSVEKPRNHLDMRHRLDSKGQREGKLIDYRASELRVVELLDGLCEKMQDYTLEKVDSHRRVWIKVNNWDNLKTNKQEAKAYSKDISTFCGRLLEETEDELSESIKKGSVKVGEVSKVLCIDLGRYCSQTSDGAGNDEETSHEEL